MSLSPIARLFHTERSDHDRIPFFEKRAGRLLEIEVARYLWLNSDALLSSDTIKKVNAIAVYLKAQGFELGGVKADGNCFCHAFLKSYATLSRKIPILDRQQDKIVYLRELIASQYRASSRGSTRWDFCRSQQIEQSGEWLEALGKGDLLAGALSIFIRIITVDRDQNGCEIIDVLTFPEKNKKRQLWEDIEMSERPKESIVLVNLGGHFLYARPLSCRNIESFPKTALKKFSIQHKEAAEIEGIAISELQAAEENRGSILDALTTLINQGRKRIGTEKMSTLSSLDVGVIKKEIPELFLDIIDGGLVASPESIRDMRRRLSRIELDDFYGVSALHIAALVGNLSIVQWLMAEYSGTFCTSMMDQYASVPLDYALAHGLANGINLSLISELCSEKIVECVQEIVSESLCTDSDKALVLNHLLQEFGAAVIQTYDVCLFAEAVQNGYKELAKEIARHSDWACSQTLDFGTSDSSSEESCY